MAVGLEEADFAAAFVLMFSVVRHKAGTNI